SEEIVKRFKAEAEAAAALNHPNIVPIFEIGEVQGQHYFSMGLITGRNLDEYLAGCSSRRKEALNKNLATPQSAGARSEPPHVGCYNTKEAAELVRALARAVHHA